MFEVGFYPIMKLTGGYRATGVLHYFCCEGEEYEKTHEETDVRCLYRIFAGVSRSHPGSMGCGCAARSNRSPTGLRFGVLQDGKYTINYMVKKFGTEQKSVMQDYVVTPGTLTVVDGKQYFTMTIKQSKETTAFKTEINGSLKDTVVVGTNEEKKHARCPV